MSFEAIYAAAIKQDIQALQQALTLTTIDVYVIVDNNILSPGGKLALERNIPAVNFLITHGADISNVAKGAAIGGHRAYAEALIARGANINLVARGAAYGGHQAYAEALIARGA